MLGSAESVPVTSDLFALVDREYKIYRPKATPEQAGTSFSKARPLVELAGPALQTIPNSARLHNYDVERSSPALPATQLERDLTESRLQLRAMAEEHNAAIEELRAANEESRSANEELQSTKEELGAARKNSNPPTKN